MLTTAKFFEPSLGGKGATLRVLRDSGFPVPQFAVISTSVFDRFADHLAPEIRATIATPELAPSDLAPIRAAIEQTALPSPIADEIEAAWTSLGTSHRVAIRSSVVGEDSAGASFAGQMRTYLHVARDQVVARVRGCWSSAFADGALLYRRLRDVAGPIRIAVVVQHMIEARASGVLFTRDPAGDWDRVVIAAAPGLGEGVVGGTVDCDTFYMDRSGAVLETRVAHKRQMVARCAEGHGTCLVPVPASAQSQPALSDSELETLTAYGRRAEELFGGPQDLEFAIDHDGVISVLQSRPITTAGRTTAGQPEAATATVFDNANIVESYPGVSSPLTFSFAREHYEVVFREAVRRFGVPQTIIDRNRDVFENLLASISGRIYYNIGNWYRMFELGGLEKALPAWEEALGLTAGASTRSSASRWMRARVHGSIARRVVRLQGRVDAFETKMATATAEFSARDLDAYSATELLALEARLRAELVPDYAVSIVNDFAAQQVYALLGALIERWQLGDRDDTRNALLCGADSEGSGVTMASVAPVRSLLRIAELVRAIPRALRLLEGDAGSEPCWRALQTDPHLEAIAAALREHLARYGDRTLEELKLETIGLADDPAALVTMVRNVLRRRVDAGAAERLRLDQRLASEQRVRGLLGGPIRRRFFFWVLAHCRRLVANREALRFSRTRAFGMFRAIYVRLGARLRDVGVIADPRDVFWMTTAELRQPPPDASRRIEQRKRDADQDAQLDLPPRITCPGRPAAAFRYTGRPAETHHSSASRLLGIACSPGKVTARARVLRQPAADVRINGEVLVAPMTDPGWVYLMIASSGLVVEKGSVLSHTAIIGRELGVPTVIGVAGATSLIADGETIEIDGNQGWVDRLLATGPIR